MRGPHLMAGATLGGVLAGERRPQVVPEAPAADLGAGALPRRPTMRFRRPVPILATATVAGPMEQGGPLRGRFDHTLADHLIGQRSWELAEARFQEMAVAAAIEGAGLRHEDIDAMLGGDLQNQICATSFAARAIDLPMLGLYGACASCGEGLLLGAALCDAGYCRHVVVVVSSHHHAAERQFRLPTEFGSQRPPTAQWTATGAAAFVLGYGGGTRDAAVAGKADGDGQAPDGRGLQQGRGRDGRDGGGDGADGGARHPGRGRDGAGDDGSGRGRDGDGDPRDASVLGDGHGSSRRDGRGDDPRHGAHAGRDAAARRPCIVAATPGRVVDMGVKDPYDMGGAEAPAAADTIARHLRGRGTGPEAFSAIVTGDLARYGRPVCEDLLAGRNIVATLGDCGERLYDPARQDVHAGGSGAACCGLVLAADLLPRVRAGEWHRLLFVATGALLSTTSYQQGESVPCVAHAVEIVAPAEVGG